MKFKNIKKFIENFELLSTISENIQRMQLFSREHNLFKYDG